MGYEVKPPIPVKGFLLGVDEVAEFELKFHGFSCLSGSCTQKVNGVCNGTENFGTTRTIDWDQFQKDFDDHQDYSKLRKQRTMFQVLRDICYYVSGESQ